MFEEDTLNTFTTIKKYIHIHSESYSGTITIKHSNQVSTFSIMPGERIDNISVFTAPIVVEVPNGVQVTTTNQKIYSDAQRLINKELTQETFKGQNFSYILRGSTEPHSLIISFPGFAYNDLTAKMRISKLSSFTDEYLQQNKIAVLAVQDNFLTYGSYLHFNDEGENIKHLVVEFLKSKINHLGIDEERVVFFGASKGGTMAAIYGSYFPSSKIINVVGHRNLEIMMKYSFPNLGEIFKQVDENFIKHDIPEFETISRNQQYMLAVAGNLDAGTNTVESYKSSATTLRYFGFGKHGEVIGNSKDFYFSILRTILEKYSLITGEGTVKSFSSTSEGENISVLLKKEDYFSSTDNVSYIQWLDSNKQVVVAAPIYRLTYDGQVRGFASQGLKPQPYSSFLGNKLYYINIVTIDHTNHVVREFEINTSNDLPLLLKNTHQIRKVYGEANLLAFYRVGSKAMLYLSVENIKFSNNTTLKATVSFVSSAGIVQGTYVVKGLGSKDPRTFISAGMILQDFSDVDMATSTMQLSVIDEQRGIEYILKVIDSSGNAYYYEDISVVSNTPEKIALVGDSLTYYYHREMEFYAKQSVANRGYPGQTTVAIEQALYKESEHFGIAVLLVGTNDLYFNGLINFSQNYQRLYDTVKRMADRVIVLPVLPVLPVGDSTFKNGESSHKNNQLIKEANTVIAKIVSEPVEEEIVNILSNKTGHLDTRFTDDGLHLNFEGRNLLAKFVMSKIKLIRE